MRTKIWGIIGTQWWAPASEKLNGANAITSQQKFYLCCSYLLNTLNFSVILPIALPAYSDLTKRAASSFFLTVPQ